MKLYDNVVSSACARVRIALALKGQSAQLIPVAIGAGGDNRSEEYLGINPQGQVPALVTDSGGLLTQSLAIIEYLEQRFPTPALLPAEPEAAARVRAIALTIGAETHPLVTVRIADYVNAMPGSDAATMPAWRRHWITEGFNAAEALLARQRSGSLCSGDAPTLADVFLYPQAINAEKAGIALDAWPTIAAIMTRLRTIAAFAENGPGVKK